MVIRVWNNMREKKRHFGWISLPLTVHMITLTNTLVFVTSIFKMTRLLKQISRLTFLFAHEWESRSPFCKFSGSARRALNTHVRMQSWADGLHAVHDPKRVDKSTHSPNFGCHRRNRIISQILPFGRCSSHAGMETTLARKQHIPDVKALKKTRGKRDGTGCFKNADPLAFT